MQPVFTSSNSQQVVRHEKTEFFERERPIDVEEDVRLFLNEGSITDERHRTIYREKVSLVKV